MGIIDQIVGFLVTQARALLRRIGIGGDEEEPNGAENDDEELGTTVRFSGGNESHRLWIDRSGDTAVAMVASTSGPVSAKVEEWRGMLNPAGDPRAPLVASIDSAVTALNGDADRLAAAFNAAVQDPADDVRPPDDSAVEAEERALAGLLRQAFVDFGQANEPTILRWIAAGLPQDSGSLVASAEQTLAADLTHAKYVPLGQSTETTMWAPTVGVPEAQSAATAAWTDRRNHIRLVPYFEDGTKREPDASTPAFSAFASAQGGANGFATAVRTAYGDAYVRALKAAPVANFDPIDTHLVTAIGHMTWKEAGVGAGSIDNAPSALVGPDPALEAAIGGQLLPFMKAIARGAPAHGYGLPRLTWAWSHRESKEHVKGAFRGLSPGTHEWIPTGMLLDVMRNAVEVAPTSQGFNKGVQWINIYHHLRTDTTRVYYKVTGMPDRQSVSDWLYNAGVGFHSGVAYRGEDGREGRRGVGMYQQGDFHLVLEVHFEAMRLEDPGAYVESLRALLPQLLWDGQVGTFGLPDQVLDAPMSFWFRDTSSGGRVTGATLRDLAQAQIGNVAQIHLDFTNANSHLNDP